MNRFISTIGLLFYFFIFFASYAASPDIIYNAFEQFISPIHFYECKQLLGGLSSNSQYKCIVNGKEYVARLLKESVVKRKNELLIHRDCADKGISPHIYYHSDDYSLMIMDFIKQHTLTIEQAQKLEVIQAVANAVRAFQQATIPQISCDINDINHNVHSWYNKSKKKNPNLPAIIEEAFQTLPILIQQIATYPSALVISHNDLHPRNIFFVDNRIILIDWEMVGINDQFFDLAIYSIYSCLNKEKENYLLEQYLERIPSQDEVHHYRSIKLLALLFNVFGWLAYLGTIPEEISFDSVKNFEYYATVFANNCSDNNTQFLFECMFSFVKKFWEEYYSFHQTKVKAI